MFRSPSLRAVAVIAPAGLLAGVLAVPAAAGSGPGTAADSHRRESTAARASTSTGPWGPGSYTPRPGHWRPYVLSPSSRTLRPAQVQRVRSRGGSVEGNAGTLLAHDGRTVRLTSTGGRDASPLIRLDMGKEVSGPVQVRVTAASDPRPELHACFSESLQYAALSPGQNNGETAFAPGCDTANIWNGFPGSAYTYDSDSHTLPLAGADLPAQLTDPELRGGYRYVTLFLDGPGWVDVDDVTVHFTAASDQKRLDAYPGHFLSSDNELNKIWYAGAYTVQINTDRADTAKSWPYADGEADHADAVVPGADPARDVIYDGGKRDRIVWQGDLAVQGPTTYVSTHDVGAVENSLTSLASQQLPDGYMPAESQVGQHNRDELRTYGEYVTWFVHNMSEHYRWTGNAGYLRRWWPALEAATGWLEGQRDDTGLISFKASGSCGHFGYSDCGHETYVNALYARNLDEMSTMARAMHERTAAKQYAARADVVRDAINAHLWDSDTGAYRLSTEIPNAYPQDANATAVLAGVATRSQARRALTYLHRSSWGDLGALTVSPGTPNAALPSFYAPLPSWFEVDARLTAPGATDLEQESAFTLMKRFWGWMLDQDPGSTFWEHVQPSGNPNLQQFSSLAHGWATGPTVSLSTQVLGVSPTAAGFKRFAVAPHPGGLRWAEGVVPTPHGKARVAWRQHGDGFAITLSAPGGTRPTVTVPTAGRRVRVTVDGRLVWNGAPRSRTTSYRGGHVVVRGLSSGRHTVLVATKSARHARATVSLSPAGTVAEAGDLLAYDATVTGKAPGRLRGTVAVTVPDGWSASRRAIHVDVASNGRAVTRSYRFFVQVPEEATSGTSPVVARFTHDHRSVASTSDVRLSRTETIADFDGGVDGWQAGRNVASVASVGGFANGPGRPYAGSGALEASGESVPGGEERQVFLAPDRPLDLGPAKSFLVRLDSYGGAPGATGYQAVVRLTGAGGDVLEKTFTVSSDSWNTLELDTSSWAGRSSVTRVEVGFSAPGSTVPWSSRFQVDQVEWEG